ncbi:hypothetical protein Q7P36_008807 [Cladosporium allicinum]
MACHSLLPTSVYNFNTTGMSGLVRGISAPPVVKNISSCCPTGHWMVKSNCTQYCEVQNQAVFNLCINGDHNASSASGNSPSASGFYNTLCKDATASCANATGVGGVEDKFPFLVGVS